jgi:hypothetical protein
MNTTQAIIDNYEYIVLRETNKACQFLNENEFVRNWFNHRKIHYMEHMRIVYNMSKYPALAWWFCTLKSSGRTFISYDSANNFIRCNRDTDRLLVEYIELGTYGAYTPSELSSFITNMKNNADDSYERKGKYGDLKCSIRQFVTDDQQQKIMFKYKDMDTSQELSDEIAEKTEYGVQIIKMNGKCEIIVQKICADRAESVKEYEKIKNMVAVERAAHMKQSRPIEGTKICTHAFMYLDTSPLKNPTTDNICDRSIIPINVTIKNTTDNSINYYGAVTININANTISKENRRMMDAADWIKTNPPKHLEPKRDYHKRYLVANPGGCADSILGRIMNAENYTDTRVNKIYCWVSK